MISTIKKMIADEKIHLYCEKEEKLNTISHGIAAALAIIMLAAMVLKIQNASQLTRFAMLFFCISNCFVYLTSTIYHGAKNIKAKIIVQKIDHAMVSLIILGTAVPILLIPSNGTTAKIMLAIISIVTAANIILNIISVHRFRKASQVLYVLGLLFTVLGTAIEKITLNTGFWALFLSGLGIIFAGGVFYMQKNKKYTHFVWHIADILCSVLHFFAFYLYLTV